MDNTNTILDKFASLAECFAAIYRKTVSGKADAAGYKHDAELESYAKCLNMTCDELVVFALIFHHQFRIKPIEENRLYELAERKMGNRGDAFDVVYSFRRMRVVTEADHPLSEPKIVLQRAVWSAARKNDIKFIREIKPVGVFRMMEYFRFNLLDHDFVNERELHEELEFLFAVNEDLALVKQMRGNINTLHRFVLCAVLARFLIDNRHFELRYIERFVRTGASFTSLKHQITSNVWAPIKAKLVQHAGSALMNDDMELELTSKGVEVLLPEISAELEETLKERFKTLPPNAIDPKKIKPANLLFNPNVESQVRDLHRLIKPTKFREFKRKMPAQGRMNGLTILFHGDPGTGKTELALQLARQTGRAVFRLDVTQVMSKWVGDSEKNLKSFFHDYGRALQYLSPEPILLLNECDGLLTRRMAVNSSVDQMNNALQNILLEELESFQGILIATTNMTRNLDDAFERRFLYKIKFELPETAVAVNIWKQAVPSLKPQEAEWLSNRYKLSAAEIYNIARKLAVQSLLNQRIPEFELIRRLCDSEKWNHQSSHLLGFS
ncbi:MAG: AAA family ATPase [Sphingomonadales bacterium]|nr:AAA family ATPase [Sphingomonadales bacterium]